MDFRDSRQRQFWLQAMLVAVLGLLAFLLINTTIGNLQRRGIPVGVDFLFDPSQVVISESLLEHDPSASTLRAIVVGVVNTVHIALVVIFMSTILGLFVGLARMSQNPLARATARAWIEVARNFPPIVILIFLYSLWWRVLPPIDEAWRWGAGVWLSMRGLVVGSWELSPELSSVLIGLTIYTTGFVAEIIRSGIQAIPKGQWEAAHALGLSIPKTLRLVIIPQALRVVVPPLNSQYINVVKNSTLVIAVGYPDFLAVMNTIISKTSHSIEGVGIILSVYLALNLALSALANWYNRRVSLVVR
ncbi:MAG: ABC transporter permease subunit [Betaproteobacteria bacterium]|jgi:general L-amino acid transport system permease protein